MLSFIAIGRKIKMYRKKSNKTQAQLAEDLDVSPKYISAIERGIVKISLLRLDEIASHLNIRITDILSDCDISSSTYADSEILELIEEWDSKKKSTLVAILITLNNQF